MSWLINLCIAFSILGLQYFLSTRERAIWGATLPILYVLFLTYLKLSGLADNMDDFRFIAVIGTTILLGGWISGRESVQKRRKKELDKMTLQDM